MENFKFALFSIIILSLLVFVGYWGFSTIESGNSHVDNQEFKKTTKENKEIKNKIAVLLDQNKVLQSKLDEQLQITQNIEDKIKKETISVGKNISYKYKSSINELQKLINDHIFMKKGSLGTRVGTVQKFLNIYNKTSNKIDNDYGPSMFLLVKNFQKKEGLVSDGQAAANTFSKMIDWLKKQ